MQINLEKRRIPDLEDVAAIREAAEVSEEYIFVEDVCHSNGTFVDNS